MEGWSGGVVDEGHEGFQAVADDINVGQARLVGEDFPGGIKKGPSFASATGRTREIGEPSMDVLLEDFLGFEIVRDDDDRTVGE
jgi:hypothetical protein